MIRLLDGEKLQPVDYARALKFFKPWGSQPVKTKANFKNIVELMKSSRGSVLFTSELEVIREEKKIVMRSFTSGVRLETIPSKNKEKPKYGLIDRIRLLPERPEVTSVKKGFGFEVRAKKNMNFNEFDKMVEKIQKMVTERANFFINVTERIPKGSDGDYDVQFASPSIPELIHKWLVYRIRLEKKSLLYRLERMKEAIAYTELLLFAYDHVDEIIRIIRTSEDPKSKLMKRFKWTELQAEQILEIKLRQLSKLDQNALKAKLAEQKKALKVLEAKLKSPKKQVRNFLARCVDLFEKEQHHMGHWHWVLKTPSKEKATE
jgi:hypothetical protein